MLSLLVAGTVFAFALAFTRDEGPFSQLETTLDTIFREATGPIHYFAEQADLDGDGRPEVIVYVTGPMVCGTGGCNTLVLAEGSHGLERVASIPVTRPPIIIAETTTNGWRDLVVHVSAGGILPGYDARLRFDGSTYLQNPTVAPTPPVEHEAQGTVAIPAFESFTAGRVLRAGPE